MRGGGLVARRTQFSSCDECRRSRVACDASSRLAAGEDTPCTRCFNRRQDCTFKWIAHARNSESKKQASAKRRSQRTRSSAIASDEAAPERESGDRDEPVYNEVSAAWPQPCLDWASPSFFNHLRHPTRSTTSPEQVPNTPPSPAYPLCGQPDPDTLSSADGQWLSAIYSRGFEAIFGSWMGSYSCPFVFGETARAERYVSIFGLCVQLDQWMAETRDGRSESLEKEKVIDRSLRASVAAFSARWLPTISQYAGLELGERDIVCSLWRNARRDMLKVINRPSYRSMLTLFLFALTPIPVEVSEEEELDGISGQACVHAALQQVQTLRARQRNLQFSGSKVSPSGKDHTVDASRESASTPEFITAECIAYWAALTFDTSASLTLNCRPLLSSGLFGFDGEMAWQLVRTCASMFHEMSQDWGQSMSDMTDDRANQIVAAGAVWKLLGWKLTAVFKEALRDGHDESEVSKAFTLVVDSIAQFNTIYRPLLEACQRRMPFLGQHTKQRWYSIMLHYHLSILMLSDTLEANNRFDLLSSFAEASSEAENTVMNTLVFGLHTTFTLRVGEGTLRGSPAQSRGLGADHAITMPLVSFDPYPHHVVAAVQLMRKTIDRDIRLNKITPETYANLQSTLENTLKHLPQSSRSVQAARDRFVSDNADLTEPRYEDLYMGAHGQYEYA